ncbi:hypothetical protein [Marinomonas pollencensis]|uniref:Lipoprotein n=1 Tax=Marinomonas pollencensis TaxID=491954 RepID=A0A3E0DUV9_9GAMM|nr:hypothetical protein [Marinomonas pollencensis]REG86655.1 hypothetical protein DFP81_101220 [Marinomonas pollencensis]
MSLFRAGFLLLPLFISACSVPVLHKNTPSPTEQTSTPSSSTEQQVTTSQANTNQSVEMANTLDEQIKLATLHHSELQARSGMAPNLPKINKDEILTQSRSAEAIQQLENYNSQVNEQLTAIDKRVEQRKKNALPGDVIQILVSKTKVTLANADFVSQPLIGQWVRGESRVIRLKDGLLFDAQHSEDLRITYSESYQLLVNGKVISIVNPNKEKSHAAFTVDTSENSGSIVGSLDYRQVTERH